MSKALKKLIDINRLREFKNKLVGTGSAYVQTSAVDQTIAGTKTFSKPIVGSVTGSSGSCTGNAATATKLAAARTINGTAFNGTANITTANWGTARNIAIADATATNTGAAVSVNGSAAVTLKLPAAIKANVTGSLTGNAATATNATYANWLRTSSHSDHLFHTEWDGGYFWTYVTASDGGYRPVRVARSDSATNADHATRATQDSDGNQINTTYSKNGHTHDDRYYTEAEVNNLLAGKANTSHTHNYVQTFDNNHSISFDWSSQVPGFVGLTVDATKMGGIVTTATLSAYATKTELNNGLTTKANDSDVVHKSGNETIAGTKTFNDTVHANGFHSTAANALMAQCGEYTLVLRNDGDNTYLLMSDKGGVPGTWSSARPLVISNSRGVCDINGNAAAATNATYANWLRTSSHSDHLFHTEWDGGYFWTYVTTGNGDYRPVRVARSDSAANADLATYVRTPDGHSISFDWSSQVQGCVGLTVDATKMGGIVTTDTLRAQWYAAYPDGAEAHNAMWGGRDITAAFNNGTVSANIKNGTFKDIFPGDYITKQVTIPRTFADDRVTVLFDGGTYTVNWVIADCDYWINKGKTAMTTHHVAIVPQAPIFDARMNSTNTTADGYAGSEMCRNIILACTRGIVNAFGSDHILTFEDAITNSVDTSHVSSGLPQHTGTPGWFGEWVSAQCNLMSEKMVYGAPVCAAGAMDNTTATRQMSAFRLSERLINYNRNTWWLRDVVSSVFFAEVHGIGYIDTYYASGMSGVRPFALLR